MPYRVGEQVIHVWDLANTSGGPYDGLSGNMSTDLNRTVSGTAIVAATETATITEVGTGYYVVAYTPAHAGTYRGLVTESTTFAEFTFEDYVEDTTTVTADADAYCGIADVEAFLGWTAATTTKPTQAQVENFMARRAAELYALMASQLGASTPGPANYTTVIATSSDRGLALSRVLAMANAIGAAMDAILAMEAGETPGRSERAGDFAAMWENVKPQVIQAARNYQLMTSRSMSHADESTSTVVSGLSFYSTTEW